MVFDNVKAFTSAEMTAYLNDEFVPPIPRTFSAAYHQHQNGVAEALWARLNTLTAIFVASAPWLGMDYLTEAMEYANYSVVRRPSSANDQHAVPQSKFDDSNAVMITSGSGDLLLMCMTMTRQVSKSKLAKDISLEHPSGMLTVYSTLSWTTPNASGKR